MQQMFQAGLAQKMADAGIDAEGMITAAESAAEGIMVDPAAAAASAAAEAATGL